MPLWIRRRPREARRRTAETTSSAQVGLASASPPAELAQALRADAEAMRRALSHWRSWRPRPARAVSVLSIVNNRVPASHFAGERDIWRPYASDQEVRAGSARSSSGWLADSLSRRTVPEQVGGAGDPSSAGYSVLAPVAHRRTGTTTSSPSAASGARGHPHPGNAKGFGRKRHGAVARWSLQPVGRPSCASVRDPRNRYQLALRRCAAEPAAAQVVGECGVAQLEVLAVAGCAAIPMPRRQYRLIQIERPLAGSERPPHDRQAVAAKPAPQQLGLATVARRQRSVRLWRQALTRWSAAMSSRSLRLARQRSEESAEGSRPALATRPTTEFRPVAPNRRRRPVFAPAAPGCAAAAQQRRCARFL